MKRFLLVLVLIFSFQLGAQRLFNGVKKISNGRGTFWLSWGYQRVNYSKTDIEFTNPLYKFTLRELSASDDPTKEIGDYFRLKTMFNTQCSFRAGYYYMNKYSVSFGLDRLKYVMNDGNQVLIDGTIDSTLNAIWAGDYKNQEVISNRNDVHYQQNGLNYIRVELMRTDKLYQSRNKMFALSANYGIGIGAIVSNTSFLIGDQFLENRSLSGIGLSAFASFRFEFFRHLFCKHN